MGVGNDSRRCHGVGDSTQQGNAGFELSTAYPGEDRSLKKDAAFEKIYGAQTEGTEKSGKGK